jgi:hypothetical protein
LYKRSINVISEQNQAADYCGYILQYFEYMKRIDWLKMIRDMDSKTWRPLNKANFLVNPRPRSVSSDHEDILKWSGMRGS